jgi:hypothetical protein
MQMEMFAEAYRDTTKTGIFLEEVEERGGMELDALTGRWDLLAEK